MLKEYNQSGLSVSAWCKEQGLCSQTYYYRLRKVREAACQIMVQKQDTTFVPVMLSISDKCSSTLTVAHIQTGNISIALTNEASAEFMGNLLKACSHAV